jgi:hypothetical protein
VAYLDVCDRCLTEDSPAVTPLSVTPSGPDGVLALYLCPRCGDTWTCGWLTQEEPAAHPAA